MNALIDIGVQHETVDLGRFSSVGKHCADRDCSVYEFPTLNFDTGRFPRCNCRL